jgi:N-acetylglutamate synthase-like GNAT family acetyltransferase
VNECITSPWLVIRERVINEPHDLTNTSSPINQVMRKSFDTDPTLFGRLFELLDQVFPGVLGVAVNARALGAPWESASTPFVREENGRVLAHVGVIELPLILMGQPTRVGTVHGVATHPDHRHRGYFRELIKQAIEYGHQKYETLILTTEHPEYFEPFGFRRVQEHRFSLKSHEQNRPEFRLLDISLKEDVDIFQRLLATRTPVSNVVGVADEYAVFSFNEGSRPIHYSKELDVMTCAEIEGSKLVLFDLVGPNLPAISEVVARQPQPISEVDFRFTPDRIAPEAQPTPFLFDHDGPSHLMAHGPLACEGHLFSLPRSART